ncbi:hypothetical protein H4R34_003480 [Dimargaris verticillata]|uniref:DNA/RNA-binding protein Kin17 WH-like domain-containing protein n=1 Tax=Dimargaris verticillata TaxID=2761393 RepID=A0A9W8B7F3_9FUNG|nr:hypothetical protein H4R34_003480 [Dimargaris verticillata]
MGKAEFMTPKYIANKMKAKGLQRLRWYCQMCQKQCRDENGFKCHCMSESHQRQMALFAEDPEKHMNLFSQEFQDEFVKLLSRRFSTQRVAANHVYQELIADRNHLHMNATRWDTLTEFVKHLGREGIAHVDETPRGWFVAWIDNSPEALKRLAAIQKKERAAMDDEEREQRLLEQQIARAQNESASATTTSTTAASTESFTRLQRGETDEKIKLSLSLKSSGTNSPANNNTCQPGLIPAELAATNSTNGSDGLKKPTIAPSPTVQPLEPTKPRTGFGQKTKQFKKPVLKKGGLKALMAPSSNSFVKAPSSSPGANTAALVPSTSHQSSAALATGRQVPNVPAKRKSALDTIMTNELNRKSAKST